MNLKNILIIVFLTVLPFNAISQNKNVIVDIAEYEHLIGLEFSNISELGEFDQTSWTSLSKDGKETRSARLISGPNTVYTSEIVSYDLNTGIKTRKILDLIVLQGHYASCEGCLITNNKNIIIKSIHPLRQIRQDNIIVAFARDGITGKYKEVNPKRFDWNNRKMN